MEESLQLQIRIFDEIPSPKVFATEIESKNVPAVFKGCVKDWKAFSKWNPANGGLDYLQERIGLSTVEVMLSTNAPVFYGDIRRHERVPLPFSTFIGFCKQRMQNTEDSQGEHKPPVSDLEQENLLSSVAPEQMYLAQVSIMNTEDQEKVQLQALKEDIQAPTFLETRELASINLWMNNAPARSSTHYDPHHNVLCIVAGRKQVVLWPPSASPLLYPMPIYGEASNHSCVDLENPDISLYPRAKCSMECSQKVIVCAGDALFIPEGWFHQVDSDDLTIAVNFWWRSNIMSSMSDHMDCYYLRRILRRLVDKEMNKVLHRVSTVNVEQTKRHRNDLPTNGKADFSCSDLDQASERQKGKGNQQRVQLHEMEPFALQALHELVSLIHDRVKITNQATSTNDSAVCVRNENDNIVTANLFILEDDPVAKILWTLGPCTFHDVILAMAYNFPRTLEALVLHLLSPVGAEVLAQKFDEMDQQNTEEDRNKFYEVFYGVFDNQLAAMDAILNGKESFAHQAFKSVLHNYLGVNFDVPEPLVG